MTSQWHLGAIGATQPLRADGQTIAVIDSGIDLDHPELAGLVIRATCAPGLAVDLTHGTATAGLITARTDDAKGLAGLVTGATILDVPVFDMEDGELMADPTSVADAIRCAVAEGATVVTLSLSGPCVADDPVEAAVVDALVAGVSVVAAAGNHTGSVDVCPASVDGVVGVAASDALGRAVTSTASASILAPGQNVLTASAAERSELGVVSGSSFAVPQVAAALASVAWAHPEWSPGRRAAHLVAASGPTGDQPPVLDVTRLNTELPGFVVLSDDGHVEARGDAVFGPSRPDPDARHLATACGGAWTATSDGVVSPSGRLGWFGDLGPFDLAADVVAIVATRSGRGYWMAGADGGVFAFGDAVFHGSMGGVDLAAPIVDMLRTPSGAGYWLFGADGGVFAFGDAAYLGGIRAPVVGAAAIDGGYAVLLADGVVTFPRLSYVPYSVDSEPIEAFDVDGRLFVVHAGGEAVSADTASSVEGPPIRAAARAVRTSDC